MSKENWLTKKDVINTLQLLKYPDIEELMFYGDIDVIDVDDLIVIQDYRVGDSFDISKNSTIKELVETILQAYE